MNVKDNSVGERPSRIKAVAKQTSGKTLVIPMRTIEENPRE